VRARRREIQVEEEERVIRGKFIRKKQEHEAKVNRGVNIPQLNKEQMRHIKIGLSESFKNEINPVITNRIPEKMIGIDGLHSKETTRNQCTAQDNISFKQSDATRNASMVKRD
jgi:hypothetical protein